MADAILVSIPGIGETTALAMLVEMPELGTLGPKQAASLAELAPISRQSGKWHGSERIRGGRAPLRHAMNDVAGSGSLIAEEPPRS